MSRVRWGSYCRIAGAAWHKLQHNDHLPFHLPIEKVGVEGISRAGWGSDSRVAGVAQYQLQYDYYSQEVYWTQQLLPKIRIHQ